MLYPVVKSFLSCGNGNQFGDTFCCFFYSSERFRDIFGNVGGNYQIEASTKLYDYVDGSNIDWFSKHGKSDGFNDPTRVSIANISLGIKFSYRLSEQFTAYERGQACDPAIGGYYCCQCLIYMSFINRKLKKWPLGDLAALLNKNNGTLSRLATRAENKSELMGLCEVLLF